jgi:TPP-dependent indolepyruvate ferredoxin oxidoreductase alpha subunit
MANHVVCPVLARFQHEVLSLKLAGANWQAVKLPRLRYVPGDFPESWQPLLRQYTPLFSVFREIRGRIVTGDTSMPTLFAFPPFECVDLATHMGGSIPLAVGAHLAGYADTWAVTGDFSFVAAGHLGLIEACTRGLALKVLLLRNDRADATGGQPFDSRALDRILDSYGPAVRYIARPGDRVEVHATLADAAAAPDLRIVVADYR